MTRLELEYIVCPIDLSERSRVGLTTAGAMAGARGAELRLLHVVPADGAVEPDRLESSEHQAFMARLRTALSEAAPRCDRTGGAVRQGDPATEILRFARTLPADLIVIGAPGADRPERPLGPVASVVIARSQCPVLTVPSHAVEGRSTETGLFLRIVCAVDLTPPSAGVIRQALALGWETQGHVTLVCACGEDAAVDSSETCHRETVTPLAPAIRNAWARPTTPSPA